MAHPASKDGRHRVGIGVGIPLRAVIAIAMAMTLLPMGGGVMAAGGDGVPRIDSVSRSVFHLRPQKRRVDVVVEFRITNRIPTRGKMRTYSDLWSIAVPSDARRVKVRGAGARLGRSKRHGPVTIQFIRFRPIFFGETRKLRVTYRLPSGRRADRGAHITDAYAYFCWYGQPSDRATTRVVLPAGFSPTTETSSGRVRTEEGGDRVTLTAIPKRNARGLYACTNAFRTDRLVRFETRTPAGRLIEVQGWPDDPAWAAATFDSVVGSKEMLEHLAGSPLPDDIVIRQVASQALAGYDGVFDSRTGGIRIRESIEDSVVVAHELAHAWFNDETVAEVWMAEAHAEWLGHAANGFWCPKPGRYPGTGDPKLRDWQYLGQGPANAKPVVVSYQYAASCQLLETIERVAGIEAVRDVNIALLARTPKYGGTVDEDAPRPDWREWLDAVDELALVPGGIDDLRMAEKMLLEQGIAKPRQLKGRAEARARYHEALGDPELGFVPLFVRDLMDAWEFGKAMRALTIAEEAMALAYELADEQGASLVSDTRTELVSAADLQQFREIRADLRASSMSSTGP